MDLNSEAALHGSEQSPIAQSPIAIVPAPAGDQPMDAREAARSLAAWRHNRDQEPAKSTGKPKPGAPRAKGPPAVPQVAQESIPAQAGYDAVEVPVCADVAKEALQAGFDPRADAGTDLPP